MSRTPGSQIGKKFAPDGAPLRYPGNTVISDIVPGSGGAAVLQRLQSLAADAPWADCLIPLPPGSFHMTVLRGLNDLVRMDGFWPPALPKDATLPQMDEYVRRALAIVPFPGEIRMTFTAVRLTAEDLRVLAVPADDAQGQALRRFRDAAADALGLRLPGHDAYTYHVTLAYTRALPDDADAERTIRDMNLALAQRPAFTTSPPYLAFYEDMTAFYRHRSGGKKGTL